MRTIYSRQFFPLLLLLLIIALCAMPARSVHPTDRGHGRDRSFSVEQFEHLVSTALDAQALPDNALSFSFGGNTYPPTCDSQRSCRTKDASRRITGTFSRLKDAFIRKQYSSDMSFTVPPETRRLASSSAPALSSPQASATSTSSVSLDLEINQFNASAPCTPLPLPSSGFCNDDDSPTLSDFPQSNGSYSDTRSFLSLKPLVIPKQPTKQSSGRPLPSDSLPTTPETFDDIHSTPVVIDNCTPVEDEGLQSFFDDSGFEEELPVSNMLRKKSKTSFRNFFSPATAEAGPASSRSGYKLDKSFPAAPESIRSVRTRKSFRADEASLTQSPVTDDGSCLFYSPPNTAQSLAAFEPNSKTTSNGESKGNRLTNWIARSAHSTPHKVERLIRKRPPAYPGPTSPLPPIPDFPTSRLAEKTLHELGHTHGTAAFGGSGDDSIDSTEILSWRLPRLKQQDTGISKTSNVQAHAFSRPSGSSIRERLGLGPRLQLHVPLPSQFLAGSSKKSGDYSQGSTCLRSSDAALYSAPPAIGGYSTSRAPMSKLASTSLVSLRSIATVTGRDRVSCEGNEYDYHEEDGLDMDQVFTTEDDPFAADPLTPITPLTPMTPVIQEQAGKEKCRSFMQLENDSFASSGYPVTPISAPATLPSWHYRLGSGSNVSSPALTPSSTIRRTDPSLSESRRGEARSSVRSEAPVPLVDPLKTCSIAPLYPPTSRRRLRRVTSRVRKILINSDEHKTSDPSGQERDTSSIVGHTESRPHSPFPMIALRPNIVKPVPDDMGESKRSGVDSLVFNGAGEQNLECRGIDVSHPISRERYFPEQVVSSCAEGIDAFAEMSDNVSPELSRRDMLSPTAWLLDSDEYDVLEKQAGEADILANTSNALTLDLTSCVTDSSRQAGDRSDANERMKAMSGASMVAETMHISPSRVSRRVFEAENETESEGDGTILHPSQSWPLPPPRTVVVDKESGEGYHVVQPVFEFVQAGSISHSSRHSIRFPKRRSDSTSIESHFSRRSDSSPPITRKLNSSQTRLITERFGRPSSGDNDAIETLSGMNIPRETSTHQLKHRTRSGTSLASGGARSCETSKTAFYSARSTGSRSSDRSTFSFHSRQVEKRSREGASYSASSFSSLSSADHDAKLSPKSSGSAIHSKSMLSARGSAI